MIQIAIVEDNDEDARILCEYLDTYSAAHGVKFSVKRFVNALSYISGGKFDCDLVFMDIMMPDLDGMKAAELFRKQNQTAKLIFVTNMAQFAIKGYAVNAIDFIVKPVLYSDFEQKMARVVDLIRLESGEQFVISSANGFSRIQIHSIYYVEVSGHKLSFHTADGVLESNGTLSEVEKKLREYSFLRCNSCYLVNPKHIRSVDGYELNMLNGDVLQISHPKRKAFMEALAEWMGKGNFVV